MRLLTSIRSLVAEKRGATTASRTGISKSIMLTIACITPMTICVPPGAPMTMVGLSPSKTMVGTMALKRLLPGARSGPARPRVEYAHAAIVHESQPGRDHAARHAERVGHRD